MLVLVAVGYLGIVVVMGEIQLGTIAQLVAALKFLRMAAGAGAVRLQMQGPLVALVVADTVAPLLVQVHQAKEMLARRGLTMGHHEAVVAQDRKAECPLEAQLMHMVEP
jgi:hypothetical protein